MHVDIIYLACRGQSYATILLIFSQCKNDRLWSYHLYSMDKTRYFTVENVIMLFTCIIFIWWNSKNQGRVSHVIVKVGILKTGLVWTYLINMDVKQLDWTQNFDTCILSFTNAKSVNFIVFTTIYMYNLWSAPLDRYT